MKLINSDTGVGLQSITSILPLIETRPSVKLCSRNITVLLLDVKVTF